MASLFFTYQVPQTLNSITPWYSWEQICLLLPFNTFVWCAAVSQTLLYLQITWESCQQVFWVYLLRQILVSPSSHDAITAGLDNTWTVKIQWSSPMAQLVKDPPAMRETWIRSLGWEDPLEKETATHSCTLAWRIPRTVLSTGLQRVGHDWTTFTFLSSGNQILLGNPFWVA